MPPPWEMLGACALSALCLGAVVAVVWGAPPPAAPGLPGAPAVVVASPQGLGTSPDPGTGQVLEGFQEHPSIVGLRPYDGPSTAQGILAACPPPEASNASACLVGYLDALLDARGAGAAFDALENMSALNSRVDSESHLLAHLVGAEALDAYGSIQRTMQNCSYKVFQGCFHGALQYYFEQLPGIGQAQLQGLCPTDNAFREYVCFHGVGHGLFLSTHRALNASLALCDLLDTQYAQESCYGGLFMENVVGYIDNKTGVDPGHHHGAASDVPDLPYSVSAADLQYPCDAVQPKYRTSCWLIQTSLVLFLNGGNFPNAAEVCDQVEAAWQLTCYQSLGRDASDYAGRDPQGVARDCAYARTLDGRDACIRGFSADVVLNFADPYAGLPACKGLPTEDKDACYWMLGAEGHTMASGDAMAKVCAEAEPGYVASCRQGAGLL